MYNEYRHCLAGLILLLFVSCSHQEGVFEKNITIPSYSWNRSFAASGTFNISDTAARYDIYLVLRHTDAYQYNNIWLNIGLRGPGDSISQKTDLLLGNDATGWEGSGMNDIWEVRKLLEVRHRFKKGDYKFEIRHVMREDRLKGIMSAGFRVEKSIGLVDKN